MNFWKQFRPKACSVRLEAARKDDALAELVDNLVSGGVLEAARRSAALDALLLREQSGSTGVGMNVAIPHVKLDGITRTACSLSIHAKGIEWQAIDGGLVHIVFTVLRPSKAGAQHDPEQHLEMMRWIARLSRDADFRRFALAVKTKTELVDLLKEKSAV